MENFVPLLCLSIIFLIISSPVQAHGGNGNINDGDDGSKGWIKLPVLPPFSDSHIPGVLLNTGKNITEFVLNEALGGVQFPFKIIQRLGKVIFGDHRDTGHKMLSIIDFVIEQTGSGATYHLRFIKTFLTTIYRMYINMVAIFEPSAVAFLEPLNTRGSAVFGHRDSYTAPYTFPQQHTAKH